MSSKHLSEIPSTSPLPQIHPDKLLALTWVPFNPQSISITSNSPKQALNVCLGAFLSPVHLHHFTYTQMNAWLIWVPVHLHHLKYTQTGSKHLSGCPQSISISLNSPKWAPSTCYNFLNPEYLLLLAEMAFIIQVNLGQQIAYHQKGNHKPFSQWINKIGTPLSEISFLIPQTFHLIYHHNKNWVFFLDQLLYLC